MRDWTMSEIEKRGLQFLLDDKRKKEFVRWTKKPEEYKNSIRKIPYEQTLGVLDKYMSNPPGGSSRHTGD